MTECQPPACWAAQLHQLTAPERSVVPEAGTMFHTFIMPLLHHD